MMYQNLNQYIRKPIALTPTETVLGLCACACGAAACLMTGVVIGMMISPRKNVTIGSHNGCGNGVNQIPQEEEDPECVQF